MEEYNLKPVTMGELRKELGEFKKELKGELSNEIDNKLTKHAFEVIFPYIDEHCASKNDLKNYATKESSDEMLKLQAEILKELKDLKEEKVVGDAQDKRKTKVLEIHNNALNRNKILSPEESLQIDQLGAL